MVNLILMFTLFAIGYYLGAKNGLPKKLSREDKVKNEEIKGFLALLNKGDRFYAFVGEKGEIFDKKIVEFKVLANDPLLEAMEIKDSTFDFNDPFPVTYDSTRFSDVVKQNLLLIQQKLNKNA